jgi:tRNA (guanine37-N1)-methyltransferase
MQIDILTLFPSVVDAYTQEAMMKRANDAQAVDFATHNIRDFSQDKHHNVDAPPYGGGAGMVMQVEPIHRAHKDVILQDKKVRTILLSAKGSAYTQRDAERLSEYDQLILICGRYEGVDERVAQHIADEEVCVGPYVLTGGELGALIVVDSIVRLLPGVLGNDKSSIHESHAIDGHKEHPHYTKPEEYNGWRVPEVLRSGDHHAIATWRSEHS